MPQASRYQLWVRSGGNRKRIGASELDRFCGYTVAMIASGGRSLGALLDVLGILDPDRVVALYYALPEERREVLLDDFALADHVRQVDEAEIEKATDNLRALVAETPASPLAYGLARVSVAEDETQVTDALERFPREVPNEWQ